MGGILLIMLFDKNEIFNYIEPQFKTFLSPFEVNDMSEWIY
jgi:hypothetical protein